MGIPTFKELKSILFIKLSSVGDVVMATPVLHHLKQMTGARIIWVVDEGIASLLRGHPDIDELLLFPRYPFHPFMGWAPGAIPGLARLLRDLRRRHFDLAIDLQGRGRSYLLLKAAPAARKIGRGLFPFLPTTVPHRRRVVRHAVDACFESTDLLGIDRPANPRLHLPPHPEDRDFVGSILRSAGLRHPLVCVCPATTWASKRWPLEYWSALIDWLTGSGFHVGLVGSEREAGVGKRLLSRVSRTEAVFPLFGTFDLRQLISLFDLASLVVGGDTGPLHIAAATRAPIVALFGPTDPLRTAPWPAGRAAIVSPSECRRCRLPRCRKGCMQRLLPSQVIPALETVLGANHQRKPQ